MDTPTFPGLSITEASTGVALVTLDRPLLLNAADVEMHRALSDVWTELGRDPDVAAIVVTGRGRAFSAGGELSMLEEMGEDHEALVTQWRDAGAIVSSMLECERPIVSAINGVAVGAGLAVALMADISIIGRTTRISDGHAHIGVAAGDHAALAWPLLAGMARAKLHLLLGDFLTGEEAERIGLVSLCVDDDAVLDEALSVAARLATRSRTATAWTKRSLNRHYQLQSALMGESLALEMLGFAGPDAKEGIAAFREKRRPHFPSAMGPWED